MFTKMFNRIPIIAVILFAVFAFMPQALAQDYTCNSDVQPAELENCCYGRYPSDEPLEGMACRPELEFMQKLGTNSPRCVDPADIMSGIRADANASGRKFNCFTNQLTDTCTDAGQCLDPSQGKCVATGDSGTCNDQDRNTICGNTCGSCKSTFPIDCNGQCLSATGLPFTCSDSTRERKCDGSCGSCKDGYNECIIGGVAQCKLPPSFTCVNGTVPDKCTGECGTCPLGTTPSGMDKNRSCITYSERFVEILSYGLALYGQPNSVAANGTYDYSVTANSPMSDIYLKSDVSEALNWNSTTLPPILDSLITNNGISSYITCSYCGANQKCDCLGANQICSEGGLCYTPGNGVGASCVTNSSDCNLGLFCDSTNHCSSDLNDLPGLGGAAKYVGTSLATAFNTAFAQYTGYAGANTACNTAFAGSHVCTTDEILYIVNTKPTSLTASGWINGGPPGFPAVANDCDAWSKKPGPPPGGNLFAPEAAYGRFWSVTDKAAYLKPCGQLNKPYLCCK